MGNPMSAERAEEPGKQACLNTELHDELEGPWPMNVGKPKNPPSGGTTL
jgi:hypothetical protein